MFWLFQHEKRVLLQNVFSVMAILCLLRFGLGAAVSAGQSLVAQFWTFAYAGAYSNTSSCSLVVPFCVFLSLLSLRISVVVSYIASSSSNIECIISNIECPCSLHFFRFSTARNSCLFVFCAAKTSILAFLRVLPRTRLCSLERSIQQDFVMSSKKHSIPGEYSVGYMQIWIVRQPRTVAHFQSLGLGHDEWAELPRSQTATTKKVENFFTHLFGIPSFGLDPIVGSHAFLKIQLLDQKEDERRRKHKDHGSTLFVVCSKVSIFWAMGRSCSVSPVFWFCVSRRRYFSRVRGLFYRRALSSSRTAGVFIQNSREQSWRVKRRYLVDMTEDVRRLTWRFMIKFLLPSLNNKYETNR